MTIIPVQKSYTLSINLEHGCTHRTQSFASQNYVRFSLGYSQIICVNINRLIIFFMDSII